MQNNDLISRAALVEDLSYCAPELFFDKDFLLHKIMRQSVIDAVPVRHGRWELCGDDDLVCSVCGARYFKGWLLQSYYTGPGSDEMDGFWYCPHCGAIMDEDAPTCGPDHCEL